MMETYHGQVRSPMDAIILFEACRLGLLPRVQRRLSEKERQSIKSGSIFVWDEREAGMRRWTDGKSWSASRVSGSFLTYREMEGKRGGGTSFPPSTSRNGKSPDNGSDSDSDNRMEEDGPDGYRYKPDGLVKQSFSITTSSNQKLHLISYYARSHPNSNNLMQPSSDPQLKHIFPVPGMYPEQTMQDPQQPLSIATPRAMLPSPFQNPHSQSQPGHLPNEMHQSQAGASTHLQGFGPIQSQLPGPYGWPPSPISTPPTHFPPGSAYSVSPSLPPLTSPPSTSIAVSNTPYDQGLPSVQNGLPPVGPASHYDQTHQTLQPLISHLPHRPSVSSPMAHHHAPQSSPRMSHFHQNPLPLLLSEHPRFASPSTSTSGAYVTRGSPRPPDVWEPPTNLNNPDTSGPSTLSSLDVQDIPNEKLGFGEDMRALRQLNKASFANFSIR